MTDQGQPHGRRPTEDAEIRSAIAARLVELRRKAGLTQMEAARLIGRPKSWLWKLETGRRSLLFSEAIGLVDVLGTSLERLAPVRPKSSE